VRWLLWLVVVVTAGCAPTGSARPALAPTPSPLVATADLTLTRTLPSGATQAIHVLPDGEWFFIPAPGSPLAVVINHGHLDPPAHARLAALLAAPTLRAEAALPDDPCRGGYHYRLDTAATTATWTDCVASEHPTMTAILDLIQTSQPDF
jgi:hypothetical protein